MLWNLPAQREPVVIDTPVVSTPVENSPFRRAAPWAQVIVAHLALNSARVYAIAAGTDALLEDLVEDGFMKKLSCAEGE
jgi:hypothetical protein